MENLEEFIKKPLNLLRSGKEAAIITKRNRKNLRLWRGRPVQQFCGQGAVYGHCVYCVLFACLRLVYEKTARCKGCAYVAWNGRLKFLLNIQKIKT